MTHLKTLVLAACIVTAFATSALADKGNKGKGGDHSYGMYDKGRDHDEDSKHRSGHDDDTLTIIIGNEDRNTIRQFLSSDFRKSCPPGLAKKRNGCLPPGQAKKRYAIGNRLPDDVPFFPIPGDWGLKPPHGYQYVQVDKDVLLISEASKKVIDAVTLLSAVGE